MSNHAGKIIVGGLIGWAIWNSLSEESKAKVNRFLHALAADIQRNRLQVATPLALPPPQPPALPTSTPPQQEVPEWLRTSYRPPTQIATVAFPIPSSSSGRPSYEVLAPGQPQAAPEPGADAKWHDLVLHPSVVVILGKRGSGKSALGYRLLELFRHKAATYAVGAPAAARDLLPGWIGLVSSLDEVPPNAFALIDEAYLKYHARESHADENREMSRLLNLSRQREQTLIFVAQEGRHVDLNIVSASNVIVFKEPGAIQLQFERAEIRHIAEKARAEFDKQSGEKQGQSYVYAPELDHAGMVENGLPTFWTERLSRVFAGGQGGAPAARPAPRKRNRVTDRRSRAVELRKRGWSLSSIARELGVSKATVINDVRGYAGP